jgi:hypothetical protein
MLKLEKWIRETMSLITGVFLTLLGLTVLTVPLGWDEELLGWFALGMIAALLSRSYFASELIRLLEEK